MPRKMKDIRMKTIVKLCIILLSTCFVYPVNAYVVQDSGSAFSYRNIARSTGGSYQSPSVKKKRALPAKTIEIDYLKIANKILVEPQPFPNVDMREIDGLKIKMKVDQTVKIDLPVADKGVWKCDFPQEAIEMVASYVSGNIRTFEFKALQTGVYKVFLDKHVSENGEPEVSQSKIIRFNIRAKK